MLFNRISEDLKSCCFNDNYEYLAHHLCIYMDDFPMFNDYYQYPHQIHLKHSLQNLSELMMLIFTRVLSFSSYNTVFLYPFCQVHVLILLLVKYSYQYQNLILLKTSNKNSFTMDSYEVKDFFSNYKVEDYYHWN